MNDWFALIVRPDGMGSMRQTTLCTLFLFVLPLSAAEQTVIQGESGEEVDDSNSLIGANQIQVSKTNAPQSYSYHLCARENMWKVSYSLVSTMERTAKVRNSSCRNVFFSTFIHGHSSTTLFQ